MTDTILLAGATGDLGGRIAKALARERAAFRVLVRPGTARERVAPLEILGAEVRAVDFDDAAGLREACTGASCVVSALSGLRPVIVEAQAALAEAAVAAGVPRFIPSDFSIDFTRLGGLPNRNFDLRRAFRERLERMPIRATSVFNGAFMDMLGGQMPLVVPAIRRVVYWGDPDVRYDMTTMDDTAAFTVRAALDPETPRDLHIAGDAPSPRDLAAAMGAVTGQRYRLLRAGSVDRLQRLIRLTRRLAPQERAVFPAWQGMQYLRDMASGRAACGPIDNGRYAGLRWTTAAEVLKGAFG